MTLARGLNRRMSSASATKLPAGTLVRELEAHGDERGVFTELYRLEWGTGVTPVQWNAVRSEAGVLRGTHVHIRHDDYLTVPYGHAVVGLRDLRRTSPTEGLSALVELDGDRPAALTHPARRSARLLLPRAFAARVRGQRVLGSERRAGLSLGGSGGAPVEGLRGTLTVDPRTNTVLAPLFLRQVRRLPTGQANVVLGRAPAVGGFPHALAPIAEETTSGYINEYLCA